MGAAFTLLEVLVVIGVIALLVGLLLPGLARARQQASGVVCRSNLRQLVLANDLYSRDFGGVYVPGAPYEMSRNLERWHGRRPTIHEPFDGTAGPLAPYLGSDGRIRACPVFEPEPAGSSTVQFEAGCGGYGYNARFLGVRDPYRFDRSERGSVRGAPADSVRRPAETVMFADTAFAAETVIEYSFAEPRFHPQFGTRADPSIHFRHGIATNVAWCDGHVEAEQRTFTWSSGYYSGDPARHGIGWFGQEDDNHLFDLQ